VPQYLPKRPYLIRALHEWITDNGLTPHIIVDAQDEALQVPKQHIADGKIVLNVSYSATRNLVFDNNIVRFEARFEGANHKIEVPALSVIGIYARETGQGMIFADETDSSNTESSDSIERQKRPSLKIVR